MATVQRFEDLRVWKRARVLCRDVYTASSSRAFTRDYALRDQLRRAGMSVSLNISEGFGRKSRREFQRFLYIAHGSLAEVQTCLYLSLDLGYIDDEQFATLYNEADEISRMISALIKYLNS